MHVNLNQFIGEGFPVKHQLLNIVLIFGIFLAIWSTITNYLLNLDEYLVAASFVSVVIVACLYYLSVVKKQYSLVIAALIIFVIAIVPVAWVLNGGLMGSIPFYVILFSSIAAVLFFGIQKIGVIVYFVGISSMLIYLEYHYPSLIVNYTSRHERFIDIFIGLVSTIVFNTAIIVTILKFYNQEHDKAKNYLERNMHTQEDLAYISYHDVLTGLYNRAYFEKASNNIICKSGLGIGVFTIDLDGLKFVNDTLGHAQGDIILKRAAKICKSSFRSQDTIARIGGDEFVIIARDVTLSDMESLYRKLHENTQTANENEVEQIIPLDMSVGYAYSADSSSSIRFLLHEADKKMYREKLYHKSETEGSMLQTVKKMLSARDCDTGDHSRRLQNLIANFATAVGLPNSEIADIQLFAEFHDVGKIGIPDSILHKRGALTAEEHRQIQQHCEIGYRIAKASNDLLPIADLILKHHEWWNGAGYPLGLREKNIPIECRIVAIADAYDAMTNDRPYRKAMSHERAISELENMAGVQFDPELVKAFINL